MSAVALSQATQAVASTLTAPQAIGLGVVQGASEFLPISSSAHLLLLPRVFGFPDPGLAFDIALHGGSLIAILVALWADWIGLIRDALGLPRGAKAGAGAPGSGAPEDEASRRRWAWRLIGFLVLTSVPGAVFGVLLDKQAETTFRELPFVTAAVLVVFGVVLWAVDRFVSREEPLVRMTWGKALAIGFAQALAIFPGVSRSGSTITAGRALGFSREVVARYSFMAALPIVAGAAVFGLKDVPLSSLLSVTWVLGFVASLVSSFIAMRLLLSYVRSHSYAVFMYYRIAFALLVVALLLLRG